MKKLFSIGFLAIILSSCMSGSFIQTAKPTEKGKLSGTAGLGINVIESDVPAPIFNGQIRYGISKRSDIGLSYHSGTIGWFRFDYKFQLASLGDNNTFLSSGLCFDVISNDQYSHELQTGVSLPLYLSFNHRNKFVPYIGQRYTFTFNELDTYQHYGKNTTEHVSKTHNMYYSGGLGFRYGKGRIKFFTELSYLLRISPFVNVYDEFTTGELVRVEELRTSFYPELGFGIMIGLGN